MRDILFKAKTMIKKHKNNEFNNVWVEGDLIENQGKYYIHPKANSVNVEGELGKLIVMHEVQPNTLCQYTGLKDKNGNKIWENDIIKPYDTVTNEGYIIGWDNEMGAFVFCDINTNDSLYVLIGHYIEVIKSVEVIGNIFDNPELLNADKEASQQAHQEVMMPAT